MEKIWAITVLGVSLVIQGLDSKWDMTFGKVIKSRKISRARTPTGFKHANRVESILKSISHFHPRVYKSCQFFFQTKLLKFILFFQKKYWKRNAKVTSSKIIPQCDLDCCGHKNITHCIAHALCAVSFIRCSKSYSYLLCR